MSDYTTEQLHRRLLNLDIRATAILEKVNENRQRIEDIEELLAHFVFKFAPDGNEMTCTICKGQTVNLGKDIQHRPGCRGKELEKLLGE